MFKKFVKWVKSEKSDFVLFVILLVLINLVASRSFFRLDLTGPRSYSLSKASVQVVKTLEEPLSAKVFFTAKLPAPYNSVEQYVRDLLGEYKGKANKNFTYEFFDMEKPENQEIARNYGLRQIQIQEVKDNEVGFKQAFMGIALTYADTIELLDGLQSSDGLEYKITSTMSRMIATANTLSGLTGKVKMTLYKSEKLSAFNINGFNKVDSLVNDAYNKVNRKNHNRIEYEKIDPTSEQIAELADTYGIQRITWKDPASPSGTGEGVIGMILQYAENFRIVPLQLSRGFFGNFGIAGLDSLEDSITESLQSLVSKSLVVGYITGHGEQNINDDQQGAGRLRMLAEDRYEMREINLKDEDIPASINSIIINGPRETISEIELYKIDQFLMKGGNVMLFLDPYEEQTPQGQQAYYQQPQYYPINTGLEKLLEKYGVTPGKNYVLDKNCYEQMDRGYGKVPLYFAPILQKDGMNKKHPITKNLGYVIMLQNSSIDVSIPENLKGKVTSTVLAQSSNESWLMANRITMNPLQMSIPEKESMKKENLAVVLEGYFESAFDKAPEVEEENTENRSATAEEKAAAKIAKDRNVDANTHIDTAVQKGKLFITGSSRITTYQVIDENGSQPVAMFVRNAIDYMNGNGDLCEMRTKGLALDTLKKAKKGAMNFATIFNQYGLPLFVAIAGLIVWRLRVARRKRIRMKYNANDSREMTNK